MIFLITGVVRILYKLNNTLMSRKYSKSYLKRNFTANGEINKQNSWYWSVLMKNYKTEDEAIQAWMQSRKRADLYYDLGLRLKM